MPIVTNQYIEEKKHQILKCFAEVVVEKPLHQVKMRDMIRRMEISQGAIYRYYSNVDEIFLDYVNQSTPKNTMTNEIENLIASDKDIKSVLEGCLLILGAYLNEFLNVLGGKLCLELIMLYSSDHERRDTYLPQLQYKKYISEAQMLMIQFMMSKLESNQLVLSIPLEQLVAFTGDSVDGITYNATIGWEKGINIMERFEVLVQAVTQFIIEDESDTSHINYFKRKNN